MPEIQIGWHEFIIAGKFGVYRNLLDTVERQLDKDLVELEQKAGQVASQPDNDPDRYEYLDYLGEQYIETESIKGIFLHAFFASSFALFEQELVQVCERARRKANSPLSVKDLGGRDYMKNAKYYLKKLGMVFPAGTFAWKQATNHRTIRNKIMHEGSGVGKKDAIIPFVKENGILDETSSINGGKQFQLNLTRDFCNKAIKDFQSVLMDVNSAYQQWQKVNGAAAAAPPPKE